MHSGSRKNLNTQNFYIVLRETFRNFIKSNDNRRDQTLKIENLRRNCKIFIANMYLAEDRYKCQV